VFHRWRGPGDGDGDGDGDEYQHRVGRIARIGRWAVRLQGARCDVFVTACRSQLESGRAEPDDTPDRPRDDHGPPHFDTFAGHRHRAAVQHGLSDPAGR
jgi:hypothetical protein